VLLADEFVEGAWPHAGRERLGGAPIRCSLLVKEIDGVPPLQRY
jgi:hypothetical protein